MPFIVIAPICSLLGVGVWYLFYRLSSDSRIKKAEKQGVQANLSPCRITYLVTGIIGQAIFWTMIYLLLQWKGFD